MRRLFWMGVGAAAGASGTVWAQRRVRSRMDDLGAAQVVAAAGRGARVVSRTVIAAVNEGRDAMAEREDEMRRRYEDRHDGRHHGTEGVLDLRRAPRAGRAVGARAGRAGGAPAGPRRALGR